MNDQLRYARVLEIAMKAGFAMLVASFAAYLSGVLPGQVPLDELPRLWGLPVGEYLRASGAAAGWDGMTMPGRGDILCLAGIAVLAGASLPCLIFMLPAYAARRDWAYFGITLTLIGVLALAASGVFGAP